MKSFLIKLFGRERLMEWHFKIRLLLKFKYRQSYHKVKKYFCEINDHKKEELYKCLENIYFNHDKVTSSYLDSDIGKKDMEDHMFNRLNNFRKTVIPWLNSLTSLQKSKILEIGCGTGCTTIALAEQGCDLISIDVNDNDIKVAKKRCEIYDLSVNIKSMNATNINEIGEKFDLIIFSASLEHMTYGERLMSIKSAYNILNENGLIVVIETPNRLFYFDGHSSMLPFYHWLPDQIAIQYSKYSPREACVKSSLNEMSFMRFGRGVSFHEFEIALEKNCNDFEVYGMQPFINTFINNILSNENKYAKFMKKLGPKNISKNFYYSGLYIAIKKN